MCQKPPPPENPDITKGGKVNKPTPPPNQTTTRDGGRGGRKLRPH